MLRRSRFLSSSAAASLLDQVRSDPLKMINAKIFAATLECPKQGLLELADDYLMTRRSPNHEKDSKQKAASSKSSSIFDLQNPPVGFSPALNSLEKKNNEKNDNANNSLDFIPIVQKRHLVQFARKWHQQKFAAHADRVFVIGSDPHHDHSDGTTSSTSSSSSSSFDERCEQTAKIIHQHFTSVPLQDRNKPFAIQGACFRTQITLPASDPKSANAAHRLVELRARCDLLHFLPRHYKLIGVKHNHTDGNGSSSSSFALPDRSVNDHGGCFEMIQIKSQIEPDRDAAVHLKHLRELALIRYVMTKSILSSSSPTTSPLSSSLVPHAALLHPSRMHRREPHFIQTVQYKGMLQQFMGIVSVPMASSSSSLTNTTNSDVSHDLFGGDNDDDLARFEKNVVLDTVCQTLFGHDTSKEPESERMRKERWLSNQTLQLDDNEALTGSHCSWNCRFYKDNVGLRSSSSPSCPCFPSLEEFPDNIFNLPRMNLKKKTELWNRGVKSVTNSELTGLKNGAHDVKLIVQQEQKSSSAKPTNLASPSVPWNSSIAAAFQARCEDGGEKLSPLQLRFAVSCITKLPVIDKKKIEDFISKIQYPLIALDFEATQFAVPIHHNYNVYDHMPFQFSAHVILSEAELFSSSTSMAQTLHREYLHFPASIRSTLDDPRPHVAAKLAALFEEFSSLKNNSSSPSAVYLQEPTTKSTNKSKKQPGTKGAKSATTSKKKPQQQEQPPTSPSQEQVKSPSFQGSIVCHNASFETRVISRLSAVHPEILCPEKYNSNGSSNKTASEAATASAKSTNKKSSFLHFVDTMELVSQGVMRYEAGGSSSMKRQLPLFATEEAVRNAYCGGSSNSSSSSTSSSQVIVDGMGASNVYWMLANGYKLRSEDERRRLEKEMLRYCAADSYGTIELIRGAAKYL